MQDLYLIIMIKNPLISLFIVSAQIVPSAAPEIERFFPFEAFLCQISSLPSTFRSVECEWHKTATVFWHRLQNVAGDARQTHFEIS